MAEENNLAPNEEILPEQALPEENEDHKSYGTLGTVLLIILIIIVILLFWRQCASSGGESAASSSGGVIVDVEGLDVQEGAVSIWVKPGGDVDSILSRNGLASSPYVFMGDGTYIVTVPEGALENTVENLKTDPDLYDAGLVYTDEF